MQQRLEPWRDQRQASVYILSALGGTLLMQQTIIITKSLREKIIQDFLYNYAYQWHMTLKTQESFCM